MRSFSTTTAQPGRSMAYRKAVAFSAEKKEKKMLIDKRIRYVGSSYLRKFNADVLRGLNDGIFVIQDNDEPISVLLSYGLFMKIQEDIAQVERMIVELDAPLKA